jgi:cellulose synthase/poly-beta-1,6-N-acetylglucosamine synthase-like glycosyltransferase
MQVAFTTLYFVCLGHIAIYGLHVLWLSCLYLRRSPVRPGPEKFETLPKVTVQLPVFNERLVVARLIRAVAAMDWPREKLQIQVLDDSTDITVAIAAHTISQLKHQGYQIAHIRRPNRDGYKAGALANGLRSATGEFVAVFDADNLPRPDFLRRIMPYLADARVGLAQARWSFLNREQSLLCRAQALFLDGHFFIEQAARCRSGLFMNFNGTAGVWRRQAIEDAGGWQADTLTEDLDLSYRAQMAGWKFVMAEDVEVPTELPAAIRSFKAQQYRWARGAIETGLKNLPRLTRSSLPLKIKIEAWFHLTQKTVSVALLLLSVLLVPALLLRWEGGGLKLFLVDLPILLAGTGSMSMFYGLAYRRQPQIHTTQNALAMIMLSSLGVALAATNTAAVAGAFFARRAAFVRTPKTGVAGGTSAPTPGDYRIRFDRTLGVETLLTANALLAVGFSVHLDLLAGLPFLASFVVGYGYFTVLSLRDGYA